MILRIIVLLWVYGDVGIWMIYCIIYILQMNQKPHSINSSVRKKSWNCSFSNIIMYHVFKLTRNILSEDFKYSFQEAVLSKLDRHSCFLEREARRRRRMVLKIKKIELKMVIILSVAQLVTTFIFISAWDKPHVKRDNSWNSTQKMRTIV